MANVVRAVLTEDGRTEIAKLGRGTSTSTGLSFFRIGEGGFEDVGGGIFEPKAPSQTLSDIEAQGFGTKNPEVKPEISISVVQSSKSAPASNVKVPPFMNIRLLLSECANPAESS